MLEAWWVVKETAREKGRSFGYAFFFAVLSLASSDILGSSVEYPSLRTTEKISHAERPLFVIGDKYSFNNPEITWEVTAVHGQRVYWRSASGDEQVTSTNPLLPAFAWQSKRRGSGQRIISNKTGDIFPLKIGARMTFRSTVSTDKPPFGWEFEWSCDVMGKERVTVPAGAFDSFRVECGRRGSREFVFYYVPEIGHYARMEAIGPDGKNTVTRNLIGYKHGETSVSSPYSKSSSSELVYPIRMNDKTYDPPSTTNRQTQSVNASESSESQNIAVEEMQQSSVIHPQKNSIQVTNNNIADLSVLGLDHEYSKNNPIITETIRKTVPITGKSPHFTSPPNSKSGAARPIVDHSVIIHLASYRDVDSASRAWLDLKQKYELLFVGLNPEIQRVELKGKGIYFRLYAAALPSKSFAQNICQQLKRRGDWCAVSGR